jgi:hypothetical protein
VTAEEDIALASAIVAGIKELLALRDAAKAGTVTPQAALDAAQLFTDRIAANRKAAEAALDAKFPASTP